MTHRTVPAAGDPLSPDINEAQFWSAVDRMDLPALCAVVKAESDNEVGALATALPLLSTWRQRNKTASVLSNRGYRPVWRPVRGEWPAMRGCWLVLVPADYPDELVTSLAERGVDVVPLELSANMSRTAVSAQLLNALARRELTGMLSLLGLDERAQAGHPDLSVGVTTTLTLVQALADIECTVPLWWVTQGAVATPDFSRHQSYVWGISRVVATEHPAFWGGIVDLPATVDTRAWDLLAAAVGNANGEDQLAVRPTGLLARRLVRVKPAHVVRPQWNPAGTVLITGGTGRLGAQVARWLAVRGAQRLLLVSRTGPKADNASELEQELAGLGALGSVVACDVTDRPALAELLATVPAEHPLTAVVHAAGVQHEGVITGLAARHLDAVLSPTALGAWHLHELTRHLDLSGFVLFASLAGTCGTRARACRAAADAYLEALAEHRREQGLPGIAVSWGPWLPDRAAGSRTAALRALRRTGIRPMTAQSAGEGLAEIVDRLAGPVLLADVDWERFIRIAAPSTLFDEIAEVADLQRRSAATGTASLEVLSRLSDGARRRALLGIVRGHAAVVAGHRDVHLIESRRPFRELGFDSAGAIEFRNRLLAATGVALPTSVVFDYPTPETLTGLLAERIWPADHESDDEPVTGSGQPASARLACATDDEMFAFIEDELGIA